MVFVNICQLNEIIKIMNVKYYFLFVFLLGLGLLSRAQPSIFCESEETTYTSYADCIDAGNEDWQCCLCNDSCDEEAKEKQKLVKELIELLGNSDWKFDASLQEGQLLEFESVEEFQIYWKKLQSDMLYHSAKRNDLKSKMIEGGYWYTPKDSSNYINLIDSQNLELLYKGEKKVFTYEITDSGDPSYLLLQLWENDVKVQRVISAYQAFLATTDQDGRPVVFRKDNYVCGDK